MSLTISSGPLAGRPPETINYRIDGPAHKLLMQEFPRRVRASFGGETVVDTVRAMLLHETGLLPQVYVPQDDIRADLLRPTDHHTYCPFKGTASYWSVATAGGQVAENAIWTYPDPNEESRWLRGYAGFYWDAMDEWYDEDERVEGHIRDPYHRVDVRRSSRPVRVMLGDTVLAQTRRPLLLSETGLPNRFYIPSADVRQDLLEESDTHTVCAYKGTASYWTVSADGRKLTDAVLVIPAGGGRRRRHQRLSVLPPRGADHRGRPAGLEPAGLEPAGLEPAGLEPAGLEPAGLEPAGLEPAGLEPAGLEPAGLEPAGLEPARGHPGRPGSPAWSPDGDSGIRTPG